MSRTTEQTSRIPWYERAHLWAQVNLTENDPAQCDPDSYREYWRRTKTEGVVINCGGIVTYYKSRFPYQYRAESLGDTDYFALWNRAARAEGLTVIARMDINCTSRQLYEQHPDWYCRDAQGNVILSQGRYVTCVNGGYYQEFVPEVFHEIIENYHPDGFADNSWAGSGIHTICYCDNCKRIFAEKYHSDLPKAVDWEDPIYRKWVKWNYQIRVDNWRMFNRITAKYGGPDCKWMGMINADPFSTGGRFYDIKNLIADADFIFCDHQSRDKKCGFEQNALNGNLLRLASHENIIATESMAHYYKGLRTFRLSAAFRPEVRKWMMEGIAGQLSPWCHFVGGVTQDQRRFAISDDIQTWIHANKKYLYDRTNRAQVGVLWNQESSIYYGRDDSDRRSAACFRGMTTMLSKAGIPFVPVHTDDLDCYGERMSLLILPNVAILTQEQEASVIRFLEQGGHLVLTDETGLYDAEGEWQGPGQLYDYLGIRPGRTQVGSTYTGDEDWKTNDSHNYLRLLRENGSDSGLFAGLDGAEVVGFGGRIQSVESADNAWEKRTGFIPEFPIYPPEFAWIREESADCGIYTRTFANGSRVAYVPADLDRCYALFRIPDHRRLLENIVNWAAGDTLGVRCRAAGHVNCNIYQKEREQIVHLVNLAGTEVPMGSLETELPLLDVALIFRGKQPFTLAKGLWTGETYPVEHREDTTIVTIPILREQEILVLGTEG